MKVIAIKPAFHRGSRVRPGDEAEVSDNTKGSWFVKADALGAKTARAVRAPKTREEPRALSELAKGEVKTFTDVNSGEIA